VKYFSWRVVIYALVIASLFALPYIVGVLQTPDGWQYSGAAAIPSGFLVDYNSHLAKMWQGARGEWAYHLLFTHEAHPGIVGVQGFYVALGATAGATGLSFPFVYHVARFLLTITMILALWRVACRYVESAATRWTMLLFSTLVMGWGWLLYLVPSLFAEPPQPIEFWLMDAYNLTGAFYMPHFAAAITLQSVAWLTFLAYLEAPNKRSLLVLTLALAADTLIQPYVVLITFPVFGLVAAYHLIILPIRAGHKPTLTPLIGLCVAAGIHGGLAVWQYLTLNGHPVWANFTRQNITLSPEVIYYALGYLPFLIPIAIGLWLNRRMTPDRLAKTQQAQVPLPTEWGGDWLIPLLWLLAVVLLLYAPLPTQRRYLLGVQTPLAVCAAWGWSLWMKHIKPRRRLLVALPFFAMSFLAGTTLILGNASALNTKSTPAAFYSPDELAGYTWIRDNTAVDTVILATLDGTGQGSGGRLVGMTGRRVFVGHWIETADFEAKYFALREFYDPATDNVWRMELLHAAGISHIWYDEYARVFGTWQPEQADFLEAVFTSESVIIYRVQ
jgi:hypothetical protein